MLYGRHPYFQGYFWVISCLKMVFSPQERLLTAIKNFEVPKNKKEVKRFLGMSGFYRTFVPSFADIAAPMNNLTRSNVVFKWDEHCEKSFITLKNTLISEPILAFPRLGEPFIVEADASDDCFGVF